MIELEKIPHIHEISNHGPYHGAREKNTATFQARSTRQNKLVPSLEEAIRRTGLKDGMTISFHHHFRNGDHIINTVVDKLAEMGYKNLTLAASSLAAVHAPLIRHIQNGVITHIETSGMRGELAEQESGHVFLAFGVHMHETAFMRVHVLHHLVELDIRCDFAELVVPVFAFGLQGWLDCRFGFARVPPHFEIDLRLAFRTDFLACLPFLFFDFLFDQFGYFRVTSAEGVDEFLRHSLDLVDHGFGAGVLSEGPRPTEPFCEQVLEQVLMHFADLDHACVDLPSVQRGPDLVGRTAHAVAEDDVLVWLRVAVATVVMVEHEAGHPVGRYAGDAALARARGRVFLFEIFDGHFRGPAHAFVDSVTGLFIAERPEDADAFRLSCGQVESGDRSFAVVSLDQFHVAEVLAVGRVASFVDELAHGFAGCRGPCRRRARLLCRSNSLAGCLLPYSMPLGRQGSTRCRHRSPPARHGAGIRRC